MEKINKSGRPKIELDIDSFEKLCSLQCTKNEICAFFDDIDEKTLTRWCKDTYGMGFQEIYQIKSAKGKMSLRRTQFKIAENGNATMAIFLGKQYLGQKDTIAVENESLDKVDELLKGLRENAKK